MSLIFPLNLDKKNDKHFTEYKPIISKKINACEYKLIFNSQKQNKDIQSICEFTLNAVLMENVNIKTKIKEYDLHKIPHHGVKVTFNVADGPLIITLTPKDYCSKIHIWGVTEKSIPEFVNISWDKIYIINLKRRPERMENMMMQLEDLGISNYEFIEAVDSHDEKIIKEYEDLKKENKTIIITAGHYGCLKSHIKAILKAKKDDLENVMILEDDAIFDRDFVEKMKTTKVPKYDMLYLGGISRCLKIYFDDWGSAKEIMGTYGYILNKRMYYKTITGMTFTNIYADTYYLKKVQDTKDIKAYILNDYIKTTIDSTDTSNKNSMATKPLEYINNFEKYATCKNSKL
jgi:hypothetical protein